MDRPFSFDKIPAGGSIVGRSAEIATVLSALDTGGTNLALYGEARSGKETIVREAIDRYLQKHGQAIVCDIDLTGLRTSEQFVALWRRKMKECANEMNRGALLPFDISLDEVPEKKIFDLPQVIASESGRPIIIYFKEFQNLLRIEDEQFHIEILDRAWSRHKSIRYLFTGSFVNAMKSIFEERKCFYGMCRTLLLQPLDKKLVCEYIRSAFLNLGRVIEAEEILAIYEMSAGNMWYVKQLCALCYAMPAGYISRVTVNQARDLLLATHVPRFKHWLFDLTVNQINLLHAIVDGIRKFTSADTMERYRLNSSAGVARSREALAKRELVVFDEEDNARLTDPLFEYWLRNYYFV